MSKGALQKYVERQLLPGEKLHVISPWTVCRIMPDGSVMLYKNNAVSVHCVPLSRHDIKSLKSLRLPVPIFHGGPESDKDVHTEHCCLEHGCKYGDENCPVATQLKFQSHACESCYMDASEGANPDMPYTIDKIIETCGGCPAQWSARTDDGKYVYIRYRHGQFRVDVEEETVMEDQFISAYGGDGVLSFEELVTRTAGILDFSRAKWVETREEVEG